ncbi:MAG: hypothetical protein RSC51_04755 [Oscillospiraceae bacterium]
MIIGLDLGASAIKVVGLEGDEILFTLTENKQNINLDSFLRAVIKAQGYRVSDVSAVALTGVGAEQSNLRKDVVPIIFVPEIIATGEGGAWLSKCSRAIVISLGTGTSLVFANEGNFTHVGGTGVGSGTVRGLSKKLFGMTDLKEVFALANSGDEKNVNIQIGDLFSGTDTLPLDLTASNLAKCGGNPSDGDWAAGVIIMALEVAGSHAALACQAYDVDTVVVTGGLSQTDIALRCYAGFTRLYKPDYIIPPHSDCATAIGAARRIIRGA